ncbi:hypothetical protein Z043_111981, partial [Scleropages formosus]
MCCDAGHKWASDHRHCVGMRFLRDDSHSVCRISQERCCLAFLKESSCLAGMNAAKAGDTCDVDRDTCGFDSYQARLDLIVTGRFWDRRSELSLACETCITSILVLALGFPCLYSSASVCTHSLAPRATFRQPLHSLHIEPWTRSKERFKSEELDENITVRQGWHGPAVFLFPVSVLPGCRNQECCNCCTLGLNFRARGQGCEAHQHLGYPCGHVFLTCCEEEDGIDQPTLRRKEKPEPTALPKRVSDSGFPNQAFSIQEAETANSVEEPEDIDECQRFEGQQCHHKCINTWGSYLCACFPGYHLLPDGYVCVPDNPVEDNRVAEEERLATEKMMTTASTTQPLTTYNPCEGNGPCAQQCAVEDGQARCSCFPGFALAADGRTCEDVNECQSSAHGCSRGQVCVNAEGSFRCAGLGELCAEGFVLNVNGECVDVNECVTNTHSCQASERCLNTVGSFMCEKQTTCPAGHQLKNDACVDVDECAAGSDGCAAGFECQNTVGSFSCNPRQRCFTGFTQDAHGNCIDIDECVSVEEPCNSGFNCINTVGSYTCQRKIILCSQGYHVSEDGARCVDVDECHTGVHRCGEGQICQNLPGTYRCDCQTGYQYDMIRRVCVGTYPSGAGQAQMGDVNECWRYPGRLCAQTCENSPGSYRCSCTAGFTLAYDGKNCEDIDECSQSIGHLCAFRCVNVPGSYQCACPPHGYSMSPNGRTCR